MPNSDHSTPILVIAAGHRCHRQPELGGGHGVGLATIAAPGHGPAGTAVRAGSQRAPETSAKSCAASAVSSGEGSNRQGLAAG